MLAAKGTLGGDTCTKSPTAGSDSNTKPVATQRGAGGPPGGAPPLLSVLSDMDWAC